MSMPGVRQNLKKLRDVPGDVVKTEKEVWKEIQEWTDS